MIRNNEFFAAECIADGVTILRGVAGEYCYLVEGTENALLLDTLTGIGDLASFCRQLTPLPITVVNTHGHFDHAGGNYSFGECYIHPADIDFMQASCTVANRLWFAAQMREKHSRGVPWTAADIVPQRPLVCHPLRSGQTFALGGRCLEVIETPGHTQGSACLLDKENRQLFLGDSCNTNTLLCLDGCATVEEYLQSLYRLQAILPEVDTCFICHESTPLPPVIIEQAIECCHDILARRDDAMPANALGTPSLYARRRDKDGNRLDGGIANIAYTEATIYTPV